MSRGVRDPKEPAHHSQWKGGRRFRSEAGRDSDLKPATQRSLPRIEAMMFRLGGLVKRTRISGLRRPRRDCRGGKGGGGGGGVGGGGAPPPQRRSGARRYPPPCCAEGRAIRPSRASLSGRGMALAQALAREFDAVGVVNDTVEDGVGERGNANQVMPTVDGNLTGDDE